MSVVRVGALMAVDGVLAPIPAGAHFSDSVPGAMLSPFLMFLDITGPRRHPDRKGSWLRSTLLPPVAAVLTAFCTPVPLLCSIKPPYPFGTPRFFDDTSLFFSETVRFKHAGLFRRFLTLGELRVLCVLAPIFWCLPYR